MLTLAPQLMHLQLLIIKMHNFIPRVLSTELNLSSAEYPEFLSSIRYFQKVSGSDTPGWLVYAGDLELNGEGYRTANFANAFDTL